MKAVVLKNRVLIFITDNFAIKYSRSDSRVRISDRVVFWRSPITQLPVPVPIVSK